MGKLLEELRNFLSTATPEQLEQAWKEVEQFEGVGPTVTEYIDNMEKIKEAYCSLEVAKLLKEKEFDVTTEYVYLGDNKGKVAKSFTSNFVKKHSDILPCPTQQMACDWVRKKGWHISIQLTYDENYNAVYYVTISSTKTFLAEDIGELEYKYFSKVEDANNEALKFLLENLI